MATIRTRTDPARLLLRRLLLLILFGLVIFGIWSVWGSWRKEQESAELKQESQAALADLTAQDTQLQANISSLQSERGREAALRQDYSVGKQGENMIIIVDPATTTPPPPPPTFMQKIQNAFSWW
jgi:cell division protein FtsB